MIIYVNMADGESHSTLGGRDAHKAYEETTNGGQNHILSPKIHIAMILVRLSPLGFIPMVKLHMCL